MAEESNEYFEFNLDIVNLRVSNFEKRKDKRVPQSKVNCFRQKLRAIATCGREDCDMKHPMYGLFEEEKLPVIFDSHDANGECFYSPFRGKATKPFRIPEVGDTLITGIQWNTKNVDESKIGVSNSCMIDGFLTDLKLRSLDRDFCFECLFVHQAGPGRSLERCLRTLILHILVFAKPFFSHKYQQIRKFTVEQDLTIKRIWIEKDALKVVPKRNEETGMMDQDLLYRPVKSNYLFLFMLF